MNAIKKFLLVFPPAWVAVEPHLALPSLNAQLKDGGFFSNVLDLNIEFMNHIFSSSYVRTCFYKAKEQYYDLLSYKEKFIGKSDTYENKKLNMKYKKYVHFFLNNTEEKVKKIISAVDWAVDTYKNPNKFYNYKNIVRARYILDLAANIISLPFFPLKINMFSSSISTEIMPLNYIDIKNVVFDDSVNIFRSFFKEKVEKIIDGKYSFIGISINSESQLIAGLTLANLLKENTTAHVCLGGSFFTRARENIEKYPEIFELFVDSFLLGEGEKSIVELAKYINGEIPISNIQGLMYKKGNNIKYNENVVPCILSQIKIPDFTDYDFSKYFSPEIVIPIQTQRGCYWRKCTFCDLSYGKTYTVKKIEDLINEIKFYKDKYGISHFDIIDESIFPVYLEELCEEIINKNLNIKFYVSLRLEKEFDYKFFKKAYKAGLRYIKWGVETGNERIHNLINKGVSFEKRLDILRLANKAGIMNCAFTFCGFPSEIFDEAMDTYNLVFQNSEYIQDVSMSQFSLAKYSILSKNPQKYGVNILEKQQDFNSSLKYSVNIGMTDLEKKRIREIFFNSYHDKYKNTIFYYLDDYTLLFLYNCKFDLEYLKKINIFKM